MQTRCKRFGPHTVLNVVSLRRLCATAHDWRLLPVARLVAGEEAQQRCRRLLGVGARHLCNLLKVNLLAETAALEGEHAVGGARPAPIDRRGGERAAGAALLAAPAGFSMAEAQCDIDVKIVARLAAAAPRPERPPPPLYLRAPDAKPGAPSPFAGLFDEAKQ